MNKESKNKMLSTYKKLFIVFSILSGLALNVYLVLMATNYRSQAAVKTAEFYFEPPVGSLPPDSSFNLMLDPKSQEISFVQSTIYFDPQLLQLRSNVSVNTATFDLAYPPTSVSEANSTGIVEVVLTQRPGTTSPSEPFRIVTMPFSYADNNISGRTYITVIDEESQIVGRTIEEIPFAFRHASVGAGVSISSEELGSGTPFANAQGSCPEQHIDTAIGCIPLGSQAMTEFLLRWGLGIAGGIALILIVYSGYMMTTSTGDVNRLQAGKELLTAALMGLILLVLAAYILKFIGVDLLQLPGF